MSPGRGTGALRAAPIFAALGDTTRLSLVRRLSTEGPLSITRLSEGSGMTRQAITRHLDALSRVGLVRDTRDGRERVFSLDLKRLEVARQYLDHVSLQWDRAASRLKAFVEQDDDRDWPEPTRHRARVSGLRASTTPAWARAGGVWGAEVPSRDQRIEGAYMRARLSMLLTIAAGCQGASSPDPVQVRQTIEAGNAALVRWYAAGHADSVGTLFAQDAWQMPPNSQPLVGRDSIVAFWRGVTSTGRVQFELSTQEVMLNGSLAAERGTYTVSFQAGPGAPMPSFQDRGNYVVVWRQEADGVWRIIWDAPVSTVPAAPPIAQ